MCADGGYILTGFTASSNGDITGLHGTDFDGWVVKTDANGNLQWQKCLGGTGQDAFYKVKPLMDGNYLLAGYEFSTDGDISDNHGNEDAWLTLLDPNGNLLWSKAYGGDSVEEFSSVNQDNLGGIIVGGYSKSTNGDLSKSNGGWDYWLVNINEEGIILWDSTYGGQYDDVSTDFAISTEGRVAMLGYSKSDSLDVSGNHGTDTSHHPMYFSKEDYWVVDLGSVVGIHEIPKTNLTVIPSLAHDVVQVSADGLENENSIVTVRNEKGQVVMNEILNHQSKLLLKVSRLPQGIYFIEVQSEKQNAVSKFVKM